MRKTFKQELDELKEEAAQYKDNYLRALAELDNYRKRVQKEKYELVKSANERLITQFLLIVDDFERGLNSLKDTLHPSNKEASTSDVNSKLAQETTPDPTKIENFYQGVELIYKNFKSLLEQEGVESFDAVGGEFDPQLHEAVAVEQTDEYPPNHVISELSKGYKLNGKVIRPAKVIVSAKPDKNPAE